jgi:tetratricopeptide (TPR) repeat protein
VGLVIAQERNLRHTLTLFFRNSGWFEGAISNARRALELCQHEGRVDPELLDQAIDLSLDLGIACSDSGDLKGAADALAKAMQFVEERGHNFDMREIRVRSEYAKLLQEQGKYAEAESIHRVTVDAAVERLGQAHPTTQRAMKYLADVLALERKLPEAEALYRAILQRAELTMGPESLETAEALHELALFLRRVGGGLSLSELEAARTSHYEEARQLFERSAAIIETRLGEHHPDLGTMINNLASLHFECGSLSLAEPLFLKSLKIDELAHGPEHPKTATSLNNYASLLYREGKHNIAEPIYRRALAICRAALGEDHPETAISYNNLANDLYMQQHFDEAKACYDRALEIQLATIGPNHLHTGETFGSLGRLMRDTRDLPNAAEYLRHGYERRKEGLGLAHPNTIAGAVDLAEVLLDLSQTSMGDHAASAASILDDIRSAADTTTLREALRQRIDNLVARMALETLAD